jgi:DNA-binding HxlR family transcriptional regulator
MSKRSYKQYCAVARALDVVGERWTLLLVRELLTGPKRFKDLLEGLSGIGTNLLAARLKDLEEKGVVRRSVLPPPAGSKVYELTDLGRALEPVMTALCVWGLNLLDVPDGEEDARPAWAAVALRSSLLPGLEGREGETYEFRIDDEVFHLRVKGGEIEAVEGAVEDPDLVVTGDTHTFLALAAGRIGPEEAQRTGGIRAEGCANAPGRCRELLGSLAAQKA